LIHFLGQLVAESRKLFPVNGIVEASAGWFVYPGA
jgi:hypothetical protein